MPASGKQVGEEPTDAVDVALHRRRDVQAVLVTQTAHRVEAADHLLGILQRRVVVLHAGDIDEAAIVPVLEALDLGGRRLVEVLLGHAGDFADPAVLRFGGVDPGWPRSDRAPGR